MSGGEAAHKHVERRLASTIDLVMSVLIVCDAALSRGHDPDRASWRHEVLQTLDDTHGTQGIGHHHTYEFVGRNVSDHFTSTDAGIDEQHVELSGCQARPQRGNLIRMVDVHGLYFESICGASQ